MILLIQTYGGANGALKRHWPYFVMKSGADEFWLVATTRGDCLPPEDWRANKVELGEDKYIDGSHLPQRLLDTIAFGLEASLASHLMVCEYDTVFFHPVAYKKMKAPVAAPLSGGPTWGSKAAFFSHNPWLFRRDAAKTFLEVGSDAIAHDNICYRHRGEASSPESSPDVFFGYVCGKAGLEVQHDLWTEYSRNDLSNPAHLEEARQAFLSGVDVIHGIKTDFELDYIQNGSLIAA